MYSFKSIKHVMYYLQHLYENDGAYSITERILTFYFFKCGVTLVYIILVIIIITMNSCCPAISRFQCIVTHTYHPILMITICYLCFMHHSICALIRIVCELHKCTNLRARRIKRIRELNDKMSVWLYFV